MAPKGQLSIFSRANRNGHFIAGSMTRNKKQVSHSGFFTKVFIRSSQCGLIFAYGWLIMDLTSSPQDNFVDDMTMRVFHPDTLLPYQYFATFQRSTPLEPEKRLMHAILEDAVTSCRLYFAAETKHHKKLFRDARQWIWSRDDKWLFSFENVCAALGLDEQCLRNGLARLERENDRSAFAESSRNYEFTQLSH